MRGESDQSSSRRLIIAGVIWLVLTAIVELLVVWINWHPFGASREARITDEAFDLLMYMAVPVFTFVLVMGGYALWSDRDSGDEADGPPIRTNGMFVGAWMVITSVLAVVVIITPGFSGLDALRAEPTPDLVVDVSGERWNWQYTYAESGVETQGTLMLPLDQRVMFRITATDVIHSFWIPAFRIKQDAVPGRVTFTMVTPEKLGTFAEEDGMRAQCAELCGVGHARMWTEVSVVTQADFDAWIEAAGG